ncbi:MAG TPA: hypothetical protein VGR30_16615 [Candidatus Binatia bacterium]|nr:hypothetical protein [Candidatus Binatia bacterium]
MKKKIVLALALVLALNAAGLAGCSIHRNYYGGGRWYDGRWHDRRW